jgi:hypothetical protein
MAGVRLTVELGPDAGDVDQVLDVELDDLVAVLDVTGEPVRYRWELPGGAVIRLQVARTDTP